MLEGKLENGFEFRIEDEVLDDYELLEVFSELDENPTRILKAAKILLEKEQFNELKKLCSVNGRCKSSLMIKSIHELFEKAKPVKN